MSRTAILNFIAAERGGALTYAMNFCRQLARLETEDRFIVLLCTDGYEAGAPWPEAAHTEYRVYGWPKRSFMHRLWFDQHTVKRLARRCGADSVYSQLFAIINFPGRQVLNLRNPIYFSAVYEDRYGNTRSAHKRVEFSLRKRWTDWSIRQADVVVAPTEAMIEKAKGQMGDNRRIWCSVHHGFSRDDFFTGCELNTEQRSMIDALPSGEPTILYVSPFREHKNVETLISGFDCYRGCGNAGKLVLTFEEEDFQGDAGVRAQEALERCRYKDDIVFLGKVPWRQIWNVYAACDVFAFPSYLESFGFPMVEAMASGLPVVASRTEVNQEICQDAAVYFETYEPEDLADKLCSVLGDRRHREHLSRLGMQRSGEFSWAKHVRKIVDLVC